ncbi:MAG: hypothetical protein JST92_14540 [Deltaproteobacteria bacterium]|nr:hypothetical protein [Deltaproteobacteria bacterium]
MAILSTLKQGDLGSWKSLDEFLEALRLRETGAVGALGLALAAEPSEHKELANMRGATPILLSVAGDLKVPKGARLLAARALLEVGLPDPELAELLFQGGDLLTDPRLGSHAKRLAEGGLPAALKTQGEQIRKVGDRAEAFTRAAHAASSVLGKDRVKELLAAQGSVSAGVSAALFALGGELAEGDRALWQKHFVDLCTKFKKAPAAAKRMGLVTPWPPFLPDAFAPLIKAAEEATASVQTTDVLTRPKGGLGAPIASTQAPASTGKSAPQSLAPQAAPPLPKPPPPQPVPSRMTTQHLGSSKTLAPAINRGTQRGRPAPGVTPPPDGPVDPLEKALPRNMPALIPRPSVAATEEASRATGGPRPGEAGSTEPAPLGAERSRVPAGVLRALKESNSISLPDGSIYTGKEPLRFDPKGKRIPHPHRWADTSRELEWQEPVLPPPVLRDPGRAAVVPGPFALRMKSLFDNRPEGVDRLSAAAEARAAMVGNEQLIAELTRELSHARWKGKRLSEEQRAKLRTLSMDESASAAARSAAQAVLVARPGQQNEPL